MKKVLLFFALLAAMTASAQDIALNESGEYELKKVVMVDSVSAAVLYDRAMIALTDWTGSDGKAKAGIDYQNQETHTVVYKGTFYLGFKATLLGAGWNRYGNFTLKVRCKDGRAQVTITVGEITAIYNKNHITKDVALRKIVDEINESKGGKKERGKELLNDLVDTSASIVAAMEQALKSNSTDGDDDDF